MKSIQSGIEATQIFHPGKQDTAAAVGNHGVDVIATIRLILYFEQAAGDLVRPYLDADEVGVGTKVDVDHKSPAVCDQPLTVYVKLIAQEGKRLTFELWAKQADRIVMQGTHQRAIVPMRNFRQPQASTTTRSIDFWFDFHSPWCYFASYRIGELARANDCTIRWRPVHLANLIDRVDGRRPLEANKAFVEWYTQDQFDTAEQLGLAFDPHKEYPKRPSRALRAALYAAEQGLGEAFVQYVLRGYWSEQKDITDLDWLAEIANLCGLDDQQLIAATSDSHFKQKLEENLDDAVQQGLFGLPAFTLEDKLYWGNDRIDLLQRHLEKDTQVIRA
ncbi:MAG: 2-hydroxychromene-2-carboxylate isomerase/predicted thioesterase [Parasphingorhabdus sp.]